MVVLKNNTLYPFEIKKTSMPTMEMIKNFSKLDKTKKKIGNGGIICFYDKLMRLDNNNYIIPIGSVINPIKNEKD